MVKGLQTQKRGANRPNNKPKSRSRKRNGRGSNPGSQMSGGMSYAPASMSRAIQSSRPANISVFNGGRSIRYREYVQDIAGSVAFAATSFPINPGIATLFAWLADQAVSYQEYFFRRLSFHYETEKSSATNGKVIFAFVPDAAETLPASKQEILENEYKAGNAVWEPFRLAVPTREALGGRRYVRTGTLASNLDVKTYDLGLLFVATQGCADTTAIGELYVEYEIDLMTPLNSATQKATALSAQIVAVTPSQTSLCGTTPTVTGGLDVTATGNVLTFNRVGIYRIAGVITGGTGLFTNYVPTLTQSTGMTGAVASGNSNAAANVGTVARFNIAPITVTIRGATLTIDNSAVATTISGAQLNIMQSFA